MIPEMAAQIGSSLIPFKGVITAGGKALVNGIKAAVDVYRAYDMGTHQHVCRWNARSLRSIHDADSRSRKDEASQHRRAIATASGRGGGVAGV